MVAGMDQRPEADRNGKAHTNGKGPYSLVEIKRIPPPRAYTARRPLPILPLTVLCLFVLLGIALLLHEPPAATPPSPTAQAEAFRWAVNRAMSAAELTQTAASREEWQRVVSWWQEAIKLMQMVPASHPNYEIAQAKVLEYERNLAYAQGQVQRETNPVMTAPNLWGIGSRRAEVIQLQGTPTRTERFDSMCKEVLHYGKSSVQLSNGLVVTYEDFDRNLKAAADNASTPSVVPKSSSWGLGSTKAEVFNIQGTPTRVVTYDYSERELLYYGDSTIDLDRGRVIGYNNAMGNLKVYIAPILPSGTRSSVWTLDSSREQVFQVQGTPTQIVLDNATCTETLYYGNSSVRLKNGFLSGYDNLDQNLRVQAK
jgi:hypothetical protein